MRQKPPHNNNNSDDNHTSHCIKFLKLFPMSFCVVADVLVFPISRFRFFRCYRFCLGNEWRINWSHWNELSSGRKNHILVVCSNLLGWKRIVRRAHTRKTTTTFVTSHIYIMIWNKQRDLRRELIKTKLYKWRKWKRDDDQSKYNFLFRVFVLPYGCECECWTLERVGFSVSSIRMNFV